MRIAIFSDSHDHVDNLDTAVSTALARAVDTWIHLGDYVAPFVAEPLLQMPPALKLIFGNNDGEKVGLINQLGPIDSGPVHFVEEDQSWFIMHEPYALAAAQKSNQYQWICYGHTHRHTLEKTATAIVINPGEICGWRSGISSFSIVDTVSRSAEIVDIDGQQLESCQWD